ncbi:MAG: chloramphenicol-sensitive protein RarD [Cryomorphaceae bacterium]
MLVNQYLGLIYAVSAYTFWGLLPIFWKQISHIDSIEIVMHRMVWSCVLVLGLIIIQGQGKALFKLYKQPKLLGRLFMASILISANWAIFIWAVNAGFIVEASMGYFINPLINVLFGYLFFSERLRRGHWLALSIVLLSVGYLVIAYGTVPYIALTLACSFSCYAAVKKTISIPATHGLAIETSFLVVPAAVYLVYLDQQGLGGFGRDIALSGMLILGGLVTLIPLVLFAAAAKLVSMTTLGMSQYIGPTLQLICGVLLYNEPFGSERFIAFSLIWLAILIFSVDEIRHQRLRRRMINSPG